MEQSFSIDVCIKTHQLILTHWCRKDYLGHCVAPLRLYKWQLLLITPRSSGACTPAPERVPRIYIEFFSKISGTGSTTKLETLVLPWWLHCWLLLKIVWIPSSEIFLWTLSPQTCSTLWSTNTWLEFSPILLRCLIVNVSPILKHILYPFTLIA